MTASNSSEELLDKVFAQHTGSNKDLDFVDTLFSYLQRHTPLLNTDDNVRKVQNIAVKYTQIAQVQAHRAKQAAAATSSVTTPQPFKSSTTNTPAPTTTKSTNDKVLPDKTTEKTESGKLKPNAGRGATTDQYTWSQTLDLVECTIPIPNEVTKKQITVEIEKNQLTVQLGSNTIIDDKPYKHIDTSDATWTIESNDNARTLNLYLPKFNKMEWWSKLLQSESDEIDIQSIQPENSNLSDLDGETRSTVEKMMFEQRMKQQGKPAMPNIPATAAGGTVDKNEALRKFMAQHPELDFSKAKINM